MRLDTVASMLKGGDSGTAITRGDASKSALFERITATDIDERMPPESEGGPLSAEQIELLRGWIAAGAPSPKDEQPEADPKKHWAFQPIVRPAVPTVNDTGWIKNPVDAFLANKHQQIGVTPQGEASRLILLRRLHFDLIGVPPTAGEIAAFEIDESPDWYERAVKRLLDDPRHGERWGRHWMDIWRYSDWWGLGAQLRNSQNHIWHWRDWIVESLNKDTPYDEMVRLMLAADELHPNDLDKLRATGYLARNYFLFNRNQWMDETVEHVGKGFLGLTMNCAKCHDHKFDPIEHADYYRMRAFFEPYHVRLDIVPGELDLARNGIPRVYDGRLDTPTYRFIRGQEKNPDTTAVLTPGVPGFIAFKDITIKPTALPAEAWQPERRSWVIDAQLAAAKTNVDSANAALAKSKETVAAAEKSEIELLARPADSKDSTDPEPKVTAKVVPDSDGIHDTFATLDKEHWKLFGGKWSIKSGQLEQQQDGAMRAALRLLKKPPVDFDVTVRFSILGGSRWRSVGLSFDVSQDDPTQPATAADSELNVYVSAVSGGSKVQAAFHRGGQWQYPANGLHSRPIELKREYTLHVQARGTLINASLDGEPVIAWQSPLERRAGAMQFTTFDALTVFHEVKIAPLKPDVSLRPASVIPPGENRPRTVKTAESAKAAVADARAELEVAQAAVSMAVAESESLQRRVTAMRAEWALADSESAADANKDNTNKDNADKNNVDKNNVDKNNVELANSKKETSAVAVRSERHVLVAKAQHAITVAELALLRAANDKKAAAEKTLNDTREALKKAVAAAEAEVKPTDNYARFVGAKWTPTRFLNSGKDDPTAVFAPRSTGRRTALAEWITDRKNPLTARVAVNHIWMRHMGEPLVSTVFDLGRNGSPPVNQELLDWLAAELIESGWSMKHLHRVIVNSAAYRMSSSVAGGELSVEKDPDNRSWWRRVPVRLESQAVRDSILALAGTLDRTMGGPTVAPAQQAASTRRSLYFFHSNNARNLFLTTFDEASVKDCYRRENSIVPQQALALVNSKLVLDAAPQIVKRLSESSQETTKQDEAAFIEKAFTVLLGIKASDAEISASSKALEAWKALPNATLDSARANLIWALINHNDFVTIR
ncbi:MAG: hypothetical protein ACI9HK_004786 [Pirellulaceae bacterium]